MAGRTADVDEENGTPRRSERRWLHALRSGRGRPLGLALVAVLAILLLGPEIAPVRALRFAGFDALQSWRPRVRTSSAVVIVEIDEASLVTYGQWPWPRTVLAQLVQAIAAARPAAIGIDILMPEPDRMSPERLVPVLAGMQRELADRLRALPSNDTVLAEALHGVPVVMAVAGLDTRPPTAVTSGLRGPPVRSFGPDPRPLFRQFASAFRSVEEIDAAAVGHGLSGVELDSGGVTRRVSLAASVGPTIMPALGIEMLRVAAGDSMLTTHAGPGGIKAIGAGDLVVPTEPDGSVWIHYSRHDPARFVSAMDVLAGEIDRTVFERKLVLITVTAEALLYAQATPVGERMTGAEIQAQLIEDIFEGDILSRPRWVRWVEAAIFVAGGLLLLWAVPRLPVGLSVWLLLPVIGIPIAIEVFFYLKLKVLHDGASLAVGLSAVFATMLGVALADAESQRRALRGQLAQQREAAARVAGELAAARRIQMGSLPSAASAFPGEKRFDLYAFLDPAREVGGDLYDFFPLDADRICLLIGDVSGKGLPSSLFMAMSKALFKGIALGRTADVGAVMSGADHEIARDNAEGLFVTAWAGVLDAQSGRLEYCNAGHDPPYVLLRRGGTVERLAEGGGPPLCVVDDFVYVEAEYQMSAGEILCLVTDGVTEAISASGEFYGRERLQAVLAHLEPGADVADVGEAVRQDVARFAEGVEAADDIAILVLRWNGP